jgi:hypothetical protein
MKHAFSVDDTLLLSAAPLMVTVEVQPGGATTGGREIAI